MEKLDQDVDGAIGAGGRAAFNVGYTYSKATGGRFTLRRDSMTGSSMNTVNYHYGTTSGIDDCVSRVNSMNTSLVTIASYKYHGTRQVYTDLAPALMTYDPVGDWDRFDRPTKSLWVGGARSSNRRSARSYPRFARIG